MTTKEASPLPPNSIRKTAGGHGNRGQKVLESDLKAIPVYRVEAPSASIDFKTTAMASGGPAAPWWSA